MPRGGCQRGCVMRGSRGLQRPGRRPVALIARATGRLWVWLIPEVFGRLDLERSGGRPILRAGAVEVRLFQLLASARGRSW
jgi:hypothetical protein